MASTSLTTSGASGVRGVLARLTRSRTVMLLLINLGVAVFLAALQPRFLDPENLTSMFMGMTYDLLMAMGMMMLSPLIISLPFKLMVFVLVDGWSMTVGTLAASFGSGG